MISPDPSQNSKTWQSVDAVSPVDTAAGSLEDVSPKIPDVRAALKTVALNLLTYVVIRRLAQVAVKLTD